MAARVRKIRHDDETRQKIRTSQLINRLEKHVLGNVDMGPTQVAAALGLLRKTLPDLSAVDANLSGEVTNYVISDKPMTTDEWEASYGVETADRPTESSH